MLSVCIATYNGSLFINAQLQSILAQLSADDEVIISDDGSIDDTIQSINALADPRIKWAGCGGRLGVVKNFERALAAAQGDVIFLSDQDDIWLPGKVTACRQALQTHLLVVTDCCIVDADLTETQPSFFKLRNSGPGIRHNLIRNSYLGCCMAFRRELLTYALPIPARAPMHDMWLGMVAETCGTVCFLPIPYILYRRHSQNASATAGKSEFSLYKKLNYRLVLAGLLLRRVFLNRLTK